jgi:uncharacterized protein YyaL (SSP411 family)
MDSMNSHNLPNKLMSETSAYLLQHAYNPVNWYPWGEAAFEQARKHDKPILLSIGYSSCHWCHVMMHEFFCDPDIAATMNRLFINIKVDKEERPDLDQIYQTVYQLLIGEAGGWPLTMFLSPTSLIPYYGITYNPDFVNLLHRLNEIYYHKKDQVKQQELHTLAVLQVISQIPPANIAPLAKDLLYQAEMALLQDLDPDHGGFGTAAKFPSCPSLDFLLQVHDPLIRHAAITTLNSMAYGGIYDHLAGGFFRYTVDAAWQIPHFEKMLSDNAQLLGIYAQAYAITKNEHYRFVALETGEWLANTLLDPNSNGFFNGLDADSEGKEGFYYTWDLDEIKKLLDHEEFSKIKKYFHLDQKSNFESEWHLSINSNIAQPELAILKTIKHKLLQERQLRIAPELDTMILISCNGLAIKGLSTAGIILQQQKFLDLADATILYVKNRLDADSSAKIPAFLDDYAFVLDGVLSYANDKKDHKYIPFCIELADAMIRNFYDYDNAGFFFTSHNAEKLFYRPKTFTDDSQSSGNGIACLALLRLGKLVDNQTYIEIAKATIQAAQAYINDAPELHLTLCRAYALLHS